MKYDIHVGNNGPIIRTDVLFDPGLGARERIWTKIIDTEDQLIRDKLIALGWTPPKRVAQEKAPDLSDQG